MSALHLLIAAVGALNAHRLRSALAAFGVIVGVAAVTTTATVISGINEGFAEFVAELRPNVIRVEKMPPVFKPGARWWELARRRDLPVDLAERVRAGVPAATSVVAVASARRTAQHGASAVRGVEVVGTDSDYFSIYAALMESGRLFTDAEARAGRGVVVLGASLAAELFPLRDPFGQRIRLGNAPFTVIGVLAPGATSAADGRAVVPLRTFGRAFGLSKRSISVHVEVPPEAVGEAQHEVEGAVRTARKLAPRQESDFEVVTQADLAGDVAPVRHAITGIGFFLTALSVVVGGIGVMNIMLVSVKERTREIGLRKAVGARRRDIFFQFLLEALLLCGAAGLMGLAVATVLSSWIATVLPSTVSGTVAAAAFALSLFVGAVAGAAPAYRAGGVTPALAMRYE